MNCPNCKRTDLVRSDFYWHENKGEVPRLKNPCCKKCVLEKGAAKRKEKLEYRKMFI